MKEPEFIKYYIDGLENRWGSIPKAAEVLGIPAQTLYGRRSKSRLAS
jgi:hypothetical protein